MAAANAFDGPMANIPLGIKIPGIHWQINSCSEHPCIAEITAGLVQTSLGDIVRDNYGKDWDYGYKRLFDMLREVN